MIIGAHTVYFAQDPDAARAFFSEVLECDSVDAGDGWLVFALPPAEIGIHPTEGQPPSGTALLYLLCDDLQTTMAELAKRGAHFTGPVQTQSWGQVVMMQVPGGDAIGLYQPSHPLAH